MKIIFPPKIKPGEKIGLVSPAGFVSESKLKKSVQNITDLGFEPFFLDSVSQKSGYLAGNDFARAQELNKMFADKTVKAIFCVRGGYGSTRILDLIDYEIVKKNPKIFVGYSDITALNFAFLKNSGLVTYHGIAGISDFTPFTVNYVRKLFIDNNLQETFGSEIFESDDVEFKKIVINKGIAEGQLVGGNLSLIVSLIGTKHFISFENKIVYIEEISEAPYRVDRMLTQLLTATDIFKASAIIFGVFNNCNFDKFGIEPENSFSIIEVIKNFAKNFKFPVSYGFSFGHIINQAVLPFGQNAVFDSEKFEINI